MLLGLSEPTSGTARVLGLDPARNPLEVKRQVGYLPDVEKARSHPIVLFLPNSAGGWRVEPWHTRPSQAAACSSLRSQYLTSPQSPGGFLVRC